MTTDAQWQAYLQKRYIYELGTLMSLVSERCYQAEWLLDLELFLPQLVESVYESGVSAPFGQDVVRKGEATAMLELVQLIGGWVRLKDKNTPFEEDQYERMP